MSDELDLRGIDRRYEPDAEFRAALQRRVAAIVADTDPGSVTRSRDLPTLDPEPHPWTPGTSIPTRSVSQDSDIETETFMLTEPAPTAARRRWLPFAVAAAVVALVVAGIALLSRDDEPSGPVNVPTTTEERFAPEDALSIADDYFERYRAGDVAGVLALFAPDATFLDQWGAGGPDERWPYTLEFFEMLLEWNFAQGTQLINPTCSDTGQPTSDPMATLPAPPSTPLASTSDEVTLVCVLGDHQVRTQVAGRDPVPITLTAVISADGIHEWNRVFGHPDFVQCCQDFQTWVATYHRDDYASIDYGIWATVAEARASGELTARLADEWVAFTTPGQYETSPRICKSPCSAPQPEDSPDPTSPTTSQPG